MSWPGLFLYISSIFSNIPSAFIYNLWTNYYTGKSLQVGLIYLNLLVV